jgi:hypothetical protein
MGHLDVTPGEFWTIALWNLAETLGWGVGLALSAGLFCWLFAALVLGLPPRR